MDKAFLNNPATPRLIILAAGISSRMQSSLVTVGAGDRITNSQARTKSMIGVGPGRRPLMDYLLYNAYRAGLYDITLVVNDQDSVVREYYGSEERAAVFDPLRISFATQSIPPGRTKPLGTADAVEQALHARKDWAGRQFLVCNSDNLYSADAFLALASLDAPGGWIDYDIDGLGFDIERIAQFGITMVDEEGYLVSIIEKPGPDRIEEQRRLRGTVRVSMNIWRFDYDTVLPYLMNCPLHPVRLEKELPVAVQSMIAGHPRSMKAVPISEAVPDLTHAWDIPLVQRYLAGLDARIDKPWSRGSIDE